MKPIQRLWWQLLRIDIALANAGDAARKAAASTNRLNEAIERNKEAWAKSTDPNSYPALREK